MRYRDITIRNSIEMTRNIGDIVVKVGFDHYMNDNAPYPELHINSGPRGTRMTYTSIDAASGYQQSHLPSGIAHFSSFCTGSGDYSLSAPSKVEIELWTHKIRQLLEWESLEGGPHIRMENINGIGSVYRMRHNSQTPNLPTKTYIEKVLKHIHDSKGFDELKNCFRLTNKGGKLFFEIDRKMFHLKMIELFDEQILNSLGDSNGKFYYKENEDKFYKIRTSGVRSGPELRSKAIEVISKLRPVYMNGKYIKPTVLPTDDPFDGVRYCPNPNLMYEMANVILYHLTEKLEKYGNTSK